MSAPSAPRALFAYPVSDSDLVFHDLVLNRVPEFDESGGEVLWWQPIGPPDVAGPAYIALRSAELAERDRVLTEEYHRQCRNPGGERRYLQGIYLTLAQRLAVPDDLRPAIVFMTDSPDGKRVILPIAPAALDDRSRRNQLACFLYQQLRDKRVAVFAPTGEFTSRSMDEFGGYAAAMRKVIAGPIAHGRGVPKKMWHAYCIARGLIERPDPKICTVGEAELSDKGVLTMRTFTGGTLDGEVKFTALNPNVAKQRQMMILLLNARRDGVHLRTLVEEAYGIEFRAPSDEAAATGLCGKRMAQLIRDIRNKLGKAGINPDVLPALNSPYFKRGIVSLRLAELTLHGFPDRDQDDRMATKSGRRSPR